MGRGRLRGSDLLTPYYGVRISPPPNVEVPLAEALWRPLEPDPNPAEAPCAAYLPLLRPGQFFSHTTAAVLWNCPLPQKVDGTATLHVSSIAPARAPRAHGIIGHQARAAHTLISARYGIPTSDAAATWFSLATLLDLEDLVAVGDALILDPEVLDPYDPRPYTTVDALRAQLRGSPRRGARAAASAILLIRPGAASRPETLLRLLLGRAGLPEPQLNTDVADDAGKWLGRADLVFRQWRTIVEYDGDQHRTSTTQYDRDITRIENFVHAGWHVVRVRSQGLFRDPQGTVARVEKALRAGGWRA